MSTNDGHEPAPAPRVVEDAVCTACGCLCDDIELHVTPNRITDARHACASGAMSLVGRDREQRPACTVDGHPARWDDAIDRAARILAEAGYPLILGLAATTCEAQRAAVSLADRVGACLDIGAGTESINALQRAGEVTCTLGEIKNRADLIVVWGADPLESHPRLFSRYALDPPGAFAPEAGATDTASSSMRSRRGPSARRPTSSSRSSGMGNSLRSGSCGPSPGASSRTPRRSRPRRESRCRHGNS